MSSEKAHDPVKLLDLNQSKWFLTWLLDKMSKRAMRKLGQEQDNSKRKKNQPKV